MQLLFLCESCNKYIVLHSGEMSRINFGRLPTTVYEASQHKCTKKEAA